MEPIIDMERDMNAYFEMVEVCAGFGVQGLVDEGLSEPEAREKWAALRKERFARKDPPWLLAMARAAGIWGRR